METIPNHTTLKESRMVKRKAFKEDKRIFSKEILNLMRNNVRKEKKKTKEITKA